MHLSVHFHFSYSLCIYLLFISSVYLFVCYLFEAELIPISPLLLSCLPSCLHSSGVVILPWSSIAFSFTAFKNGHRPVIPVPFFSPLNVLLYLVFLLSIYVHLHVCLAYLAYVLPAIYLDAFLLHPF